MLKFQKSQTEVVIMNIFILLGISIVLVIGSNIFTRFISYDGQIYDNIPQKYILKNPKLLRLYIVYPSSKITKSVFIVYLLSILLFILTCLLTIVQVSFHFLTPNIVKTISIIYGCTIVGSYIISVIFDATIYYYTRHKK